MTVVKPNGATQTTANAAEIETQDTEAQAANAVTETPEQINARVLNESKSWKARALKAERERAEAQKAADEEKGNFKTLYETSQKELTTLKAKVIKSRVGSVVGQVASKSGCVDPDALMKLGNKDLIQFDEATEEVFGVDQFVEEAKKSMPYLFKAVSTPTINPSSPSGIVTAKKLSATDIAKLPYDERIRILTEMRKQ